jgi:hypothetical protein
VITEFMRSIDMAQMSQALSDADVVSSIVPDENGDFIVTYKKPRIATVDIIGSIEGTSGFHANILCLSMTDEQRSFLPLISQPNTPERLFA